MYESPIDAIYSEVVTKLEDGVLKAVQDVGITVDKQELIKALQYDRDSYRRGYNDGVNHANADWIFRLNELGVEMKRGESELANNSPKVGNRNDDLISRQMVLRCIKELRDNIDWGQSEDGDAFLHYTGTLYRSIAREECFPSVEPLTDADGERREE